MEEEGFNLRENPWFHDKQGEISHEGLISQIVWDPGWPLDEQKSCFDGSGTLPNPVSSQSAPKARTLQKETRRLKPSLFFLPEQIGPSIAGCTFAFSLAGTKVVGILRHRLQKVVLNRKRLFRSFRRPDLHSGALGRQ